MGCLRQETGFDEKKLNKLYEDLLRANYLRLQEADKESKENVPADLNKSQFSAEI